MAAEANNKFGIHLAVASEEDLIDAAALVNSSGGKWGYVTLVIQENDRDLNKWQNVFDKMRELKLIPIVRIATLPQEGGFWRRPTVEDASGWVDFLNSLNWVVKDRYVILFNEPNHASEWGGEVDAKNYGEIAFEFAKKLKERNPDFFIMLAGLDAAAPHQLPKYEDEENFLREIVTSYSSLFTVVDGLSSHSYPNYGFIASPYKTGRNSIKNYLWELSVLKKLGVKKNLPVFITETGWNGVSERQRAKNFKIAFEEVWLPDGKIMAVTPFVLNYQDKPFEGFSWRKKGAKAFYQQYETVQGITKLAGDPKQDHTLKVSSLIPSKLTWKSTYQFSIKLRNEGQSIWDAEEGYKLKLSGEDLDDFEYFFSDFDGVLPFRDSLTSFHLKVGDKTGNYHFKIGIFKGDKLVSNEVEWELKIIPAIDLNFSVGGFLWHRPSDNNFRMLIYDENEQVIFERDNLGVENGRGKIELVTNIALGFHYRLVLLRPFFLPRQTFLVFSEEEENKAKFEFMWPFDFNKDGKFSINDLKFKR